MGFGQGQSTHKSARHAASRLLILFRPPQEFGGLHGITAAIPPHKTISLLVANKSYRGNGATTPKEVPRRKCCIAWPQGPGSFALESIVTGAQKYQAEVHHMQCRPGAKSSEWPIQVTFHSGASLTTEHICTIIRKAFLQFLPRLDWEMLFISDKSACLSALRSSRGNYTNLPRYPG